MSPTAIGGDLFDFPVGLFVESSALNLAVEMDRGGFRGAAFGASGGIDSLTTASLCLRASEKRGKSQVVVLQMNDARVKGELYNPELYRVLGADLIQIDITTEAIRREKHLGMPPRWLTACLLKLALRWLPMRARRRMILAVEAGRAPGWVLSHYQLLTLLHRLRIARLREYAASHRLMLVICANLTEVSLGYFVEQGVDDPQMGDCAPLSGVYKSQVRTTAKFVGLPEHIMSQRPSPGFGGVYDEEIIGPYEIVDLILVGLQLGYSDAEIIRVIRPYARKLLEAGRLRRRSSHDIDYVRFIRELVTLHARKRRTFARQVW
jgi:NH3-dependent NAD+ synthetase